MELLIQCLMVTHLSPLHMGWDSSLMNSMRSGFAAQYLIILVLLVTAFILMCNKNWQDTKAACKGEYYKDPHVSEECGHLLEKVSDDVSLLNIYNILEPCFHGTSMSPIDMVGSIPTSFLKLGRTERPLPVRKRMFGRSWPLGAVVRPGFIPSWPQILAGSSVPCIVST